MVTLPILLTVLYLLYILGMTVVILMDNKPAQSTLAWILTLYFLPFLGLFIYIFAGVNWKKRKIFSQRPEEVFGDYLRTMLDKQEHFLHNTPNQISTDILKAIKLLIRSNHAVVTTQNHLQLFHHGSDKFEVFKEDLRSAQHFIHLEYFIWKSDQLGREIQAILIERARSGVEVRIIFDGVGCFSRMSRKYKRELREAGVDFVFFLDPFNIFTSTFANYLNHRKIAVIDGLIGYVGGMNIGDEYIHGGRFGFWRDSHLRIEGEAVHLLHAIFVTDWFNSAGYWLQEKKYFPDLLDTAVNALPDPHDESIVPVQIACSGPDSDWFSIKQLYHHLIVNAEGEVLIQSPYFIPDQMIASAMEIAALSGIEVSLMLTGIPDKRIPYWAAETYFESFLKAGGKIYRYNKGFFHAKTITVDGHVCSIGTCNMDVRAFELDYEVNAVIYDALYAEQLREQFIKDIQDCDEVTLESLKSRRFWENLRNALVRVLSPLL